MDSTLFNIWWLFCLSIAIIIVITMIIDNTKDKKNIIKKEYDWLKEEYNDCMRIYKKKCKKAFERQKNAQ